MKSKGSMGMYRHLLLVGLASLLLVFASCGAPETANNRSEPEESKPAPETAPKKDYLKDHMLPPDLSLRYIDGDKFAPPCSGRLIRIWNRSVAVSRLENSCKSAWQLAE